MPARRANSATLRSSTGGGGRRSAHRQCHERVCKLGHGGPDAGLERIERHVGPPGTAARPAHTSCHDCTEA